MKTLLKTFETGITKGKEKREKQETMVTVHVIDLIPSVVWKLLPTIPTSLYTCVSPYISWLLVSLRRRQIIIFVPF